MAHYLALCCEALTRSIYAAAATTEHTVSVQLFRQGLHNQPKNLRNTLQEQIDAVEPGQYDAILLVYGMCGASTIGLTARDTPLVIPRAHDCITLYLGSRERYDTEFKRHPGTYWYSVDYMERKEAGEAVALGAAGIEATEKLYDEYVEKYGKDNADMLIEEMKKWGQHYTRAAFIDTGHGEVGGFKLQAKEKAEREGWIFEEFDGNPRLLTMLIEGDWPADEFLVVPPGATIRQQYDDLLVQAVEAQA